MTYIVNENCIKCKFTDCVEVCPVDCFYEGENMLVIHPDECIDCGVCEPECPVDAISPIPTPDLSNGLSLTASIRKNGRISPPRKRHLETPTTTGMSKESLKNTSPLNPDLEIELHRALAKLKLRALTATKA